VATFIDADAEDRSAVGIGMATSIVLHLLLIAALITWVHGNAGVHTGTEKQKQMLIHLEMVRPPEKPKPEPPKPKPQPKRVEVKTPTKPVPQPIMTQAPVSAPVPTVPPPPPVVETPKAAPAAKIVGYEISPAYKSMLTSQIQSNLNYPLRAKKDGQEGTVLVRVHMARDGRILQVTVVTSSGAASLDEEAKAVFKRIGNLPPLPPNYNPDAAEFIFDLPIAFALQQEDN
jgi:protein TonB